MQPDWEGEAVGVGGGALLFQIALVMMGGRRASYACWPSKREGADTINSRGNL